MSLGKPTIKSCFMDDEMRDFAVNEATKALETSNSEKVRNNLIEINYRRFALVGRLLHEDVLREEVQERVALHSRPQLRCIRDSRSRPLRLLLHRIEGIPYLVHTLVMKQLLYIVISRVAVMRARFVTC